MENEKRWVYRSADGDFTMGLTPTAVEGVYNKSGTKMLTTVLTKGIQLRFIGGFLTVGPALAKRYGVEPEDLVKLIELSPRFNRTVFLIQSPDFSASKKDVEKFEAEVKKAKKAKSKVVYGARSTQN